MSCVLPVFLTRNYCVFLGGASLFGFNAAFPEKRRLWMEANLTHYCSYSVLFLLLLLLSLFICDRRCWWLLFGGQFMSELLVLLLLVWRAAGMDNGAERFLMPKFCRFDKSPAESPRGGRRTGALFLLEKQHIDMFWVQFSWRCARF